MKKCLELHLADISIEEALFDFIQKQFHFEAATITPLRGYSNQNYCIKDTDCREYILRIARPNRSYASLLAEEHVLQQLKQNGVANIPVQVHQACDLLSIQYKGRRHFIHLFEKIPGEIEGFWWQPCSIPKVQQLFELLAVLHDEMAVAPPLPGYKPAKYACQLPAMHSAQLAKTDTGLYVMRNWALFSKMAYRIQQDMAHYFPWGQARYQWIHGDIQLENVLFESARLTAFLDFELVSWDACERDVILSAFRVCKEGKTDAPFHYDKARFPII